MLLHTNNNNYNKERSVINRIDKEIIKIKFLLTNNNNNYNKERSIIKRIYKE